MSKELTGHWVGSIGDTTLVMNLAESDSGRITGDVTFSSRRDTLMFGVSEGFRVNPDSAFLNLETWALLCGHSLAGGVGTDGAFRGAYSSRCINEFPYRRPFRAHR